MLKLTVLVAVGAVLALAIPSAPVASSAGLWQVDNRHSDAQIITDATTDYGKTKLNTTLGFARVIGRVDLENDDQAKSSINLTIYPSTSSTPLIGEDGKLRNQWFQNMSNHTLVCFHSKRVSQTSDGRLQADGDLVLTRVDRNVDATASAAYAGPVYGPPIINRVSQPATFIFDLPKQHNPGKKDAWASTSGSTNVSREVFPQLVRAVVSTYWPLVVQDENCETPSSTPEDYHGMQCTGTMLHAQALPEPPRSGNEEDLSAASNFNSIVGNNVTIKVHLRLVPNAGASMTGM
jgi:polyisoprenoid-binding protein YceI